MNLAPETADQRQARRYRTTLRGRLCGTLVTARNISMGGAQVACPIMLFEFLRSKLARGPAVLELPDDLFDLGLGCRVVYENECDDEVLIGLALTDAPTGAARSAFGELVEKIGRSAPGID